MSDTVIRTVSRTLYDGYPCTQRDLDANVRECRHPELDFPSWGLEVPASGLHIRCPNFRSQLEMLDSVRHHYRISSSWPA